MPELQTPATPAAPVSTAPKSPIPISTPKSEAAPAAQPPAPAPKAPEPTSNAPVAHPKGMKGYLADVDQEASGKPVVKEPVAPAPEPKTETSAAPELQEAPMAGDDVWEKAPKNLKNSYYKFKRESETKLGDYEKKIKELESKSSQSPADIKKIQELEARSLRLEKDLAEREDRLAQADYSKSDEFKRNFVDKGQKAYQQAVGDIKRLSVKVVDEAGNESSRPATQEDFDLIRSLPIGEQDRKINEMFGFSASRVATHVNNLERLENEANEAITNARTKADEVRRENEKKFGERSNEYKSHAERFKGEIEKAHAGYFAPDPENPEASEALSNGLKYVDDAAASQHTMSPQDLAETTTMIRYLAGAAPRLMVEKKQLTDKVSSLEAELAKYRKSSPGSATPASGSAPAPTQEKRGIAAMKEIMLATDSQR